MKILDEKFGDSGVAVQLQLVQDALQAYPDMNVIWGTAPTAEAAIGAGGGSRAHRHEDHLLLREPGHARRAQPRRHPGLRHPYPVGEGAIGIDQAIRLIEKKPVIQFVQPEAA